MAGMTATGRPSPTGKSRGGPYLSSNRDCFSLNGKPSMNPTQSPQEAKSKYNVEKAQYDTVEHFHCQLSVMVHSLWPDICGLISCRTIASGQYPKLSMYAEKHEQQIPTKKYLVLLISHRVQASAFHSDVAYSLHTVMCRSSQKLHGNQGVERVLLGRAYVIR